MKLTNAEKLILLMLSDVYEKLELDGIDTKLIRSAIYSENTWALDWEMPGVVGSQSEPTPPLVQEVANYLDMWWMLEDAAASFDPKTKARLEKEAAPFGTHIRFPGFDGNNESRALSIARILIEDMGRFSRFQGRDLNSHAPLSPAYARMYEVFARIKPSLGSKGLSADQALAILKAMGSRE